MQIYYQNETLYVDIESLLDDEGIGELKRRIFKIVEDYDVDHIIIHNKSHLLINKHYLYQIKHEYANRFKGRLYIK